MKKHLIQGVVIAGLALFFAQCITTEAHLNHKTTGIDGIITSSNGNKEADVYVYLYRSLSSRLIGPADFMAKTDERGMFFFDVPEGKYYLVARKRAKGGEAGPLKDGDRVAIYLKNPVTVESGKVFGIEITLPEKTFSLQKRMPVGDLNVSLVIKNYPGKVMKVLIYQGDDTRKSPDYVIEAGEGSVDFSLEKGKKYVVVVREEMKEKIGQGELFGVYGPFSPEALKSPIEITLEPHQ